MNQKGFIQIPLIIIIIASIVVASAGAGVVLQKQGKLAPLIANISEVFEGAEETTTLEEEEIELEEPQIEEEPEVSQEEISPSQQELEKARLEAEKARAEAEAEQARLEAERAKAETEKIKKELEEAKELAEKEEQEQEIIGPSIVAITPNQILNNIGNFLTITGANFKKETRVLVGNHSAAEITFINDTQIIVEISPGLPATVYDIQAINPDGETATFKNALTVVSPPAPTPTELTTEAIAAEVSPAVVQILNDIKLSYGSGVIIDTSGYILTNQHVIAGDHAVDVNYNGQIFYNSSVIGWNEIIDLAIIKLTGNNFSCANLGNSDNVILGQEVVALGYPLSNFPSSITVLEGIITNNKVTDSYGTFYLKTSASIQHGSSGGALVDKNGKVIGINTLCNPDAMIFGVCVPGYGYAIAINTAKSVLSDLKAGAKISIPESEPQSEPEPTPTDTIPPVISNIQVLNIETNSATINWTTNELTISQIEYGTTQALGNFTPIDYTLRLSHGIALSSLTQGTTYYYKIISKDTSGNQSISYLQNFSTQAITPGTLTVALASDTPDSEIVTGLSAGVELAKYTFSALYEAFTVSEAQIGVPDGTEDDFISLYVKYKNAAGETITSSAVPIVNGTANFTGMTMNVPSFGDSALTVYVNVNVVSYYTSTAYANSGDRPRLSLVYYKASSGSQQSVTGTPNITANQMLLYKTAPTVGVRAGITSGTLVNGVNNIYSFDVAADAKGDVGMKEITFYIAGGMATDTDKIGPFTFYRSSLNITDKVTIVDSGSNDLEDAANALAGNAAGTITVTFATEEVITADTSQTYYLKATISGVSAVGENIQTHIKDDASYSVPVAYASASGNFIWTDRAWPSDAHGETTADWLNGYLVSTLPTDTYTLSK